MRRGRKPSGITPAEAKRRQRESMHRLRTVRRAIWRCRQCPNPAKMHSETGLPMASCEEHLKADAARVKSHYKKRGKRG